MADEVRYDTQIADQEYQIYQNARDNGHLHYMRRARKCEDFYLGGGRQWDLKKRLACEADNKPVVEINEILPTIQSILGYQIDNRVDPQLLPARGPIDQEDATRMTKMVKHVLRENMFEWVESQVFSDGLIQQRGYYDIRVEFDDNLQGEVRITDEDPLDIIPDEYSNSYDPQRWKQVIKTRWMTYDEVEDLYGAKAAEDVKNQLITQELGAEDGILRNTYGNSGIVETTEQFDEQGNRSVSTYQFAGIEVVDLDRLQDSTRRVRVIERQFRRRVKTKFFVDVTTGDMRMVPDNFSKAQIDGVLQKMQGKVILFDKVVERVRWRVVAGSVVLHDEWSPYKDFTIVPYFAYFRRGKTIGAVDNLISPQEMLNEMTTHALHIANTTANSGWVVEEDSLIDMEKEDLEAEGSKAGFVIMYARGSEPPQKIKPNPVPGAIERIIERAHVGIQTISSVDPAAKGMKDGGVESGIAAAARQAQHSLQVSGPLDNLARTRYMVVKKVVDLIQQFYTEERQVLIVGTDENGEDKVEEVNVNQVDMHGNTFNDLTLGEFAVVINTVPSKSTFESTQVAQLTELVQAGVQIPPDEIVKRSNLSDRYALADRLRQMGQPTPEQEQFENELKVRQLRQLDAEVRELLARAEKLRAEAARAKNTAVTGSIENAATLAMMPNLGGLADGIMRVNEG